MAEQAAQEETLLDVRVADASSAYKFYLNQEKKILGTSAVIIFSNGLGAGRQHFTAHQPHVHERAVARREGRGAAIRLRGDLERP